MPSIYLVRHGQASFGQADYDKLSELGVKQSETLSQALNLRGLEGALIFRGNMLRHQQTCDAALAQGKVHSNIEIDARWNEFDHRDVLRRYEPGTANPVKFHQHLKQQANPAQALQQLIEGAITRWVSTPDDDYNESFEAFEGRVNQAFDDLSASLSKNQKAIVFTSGGVIAMAAKRALGLQPMQAFSLNLNLANASISKFYINQHELRLVSLNETGHLLGSSSNLLTYK